MRILQVVQKPQRRGPEILARQLNGAFEQKGHSTHLIYLYTYTGDQPLPVDEKTTALRGQESHPLEIFPGFQPVLLRQFLREIQRFAPDVIQVNGSRTVKYGAFAKMFSVSPRWALLYRNIDNPAYWVRHTLHHRFYRHLIMPQMDGIIGVSEQLLHTVQRMYGSPAPAVAIPYVVDPKRLEPILTCAAARQQLGVAPDTPLILFIGNLSTQKRPDRFLRVVQAVKQQIPSVRAWILGDGPLRQQVEQQAVELGLTETLRLWGYQTAISPYIAASDLLIVTSDSDGIPTVVQEAGYLGKPTISTRVGGLPECVVDGVTGILAEPTNEESLSHAIVDLLKHSQRRQEMGRQAQKLVREKFTIETIVEKHLDFYQTVIDSTRLQVKRVAVPAT